MKPVPSEELLRAVRLFVWGFELYTHRLCTHFDRLAVGFWWVPRESRAGSLPYLGIRGYWFHGAGVRIEDEHGLVFDGDFSQPDPPQRGRSHLAWVDPWKLRYFLKSLPAGCEEFRDLFALDALEEALRAIPQDWMQVLMVEARSA